MDKAANTLLIIIFLIVNQVHAVSLVFSGELFEAPCMVDPSSLTQTVSFLDRAARDFWYEPARSETQEIVIKLNNCNSSAIGKVVQTRFSGVTESAMGSLQSYFLSMNSGPQQGKLAIGILDNDSSTLIQFNGDNTSDGTVVNGKKLTLTFKAFVQATPESIAQKSVGEGDYASQVRFELFYQ